MRLFLVFFLSLLSGLSSAGSELDNMIERYESQKNADYLNNQELAFLSHDIGMRLLASKQYDAAISYFS